MTTPICPRCGGTSVRLLSPGYYECTSTVLTDVVPPGAHGNASAIPLTRVCGHRFQVGTGQQPAAQCSCGMFAIGTCRRCGAPRCGEHASLDGAGTFVCNSHIEEDERRLADDEARREGERRRASADAAREAEAQRQDMLRARQAALPEFPVEGGASASQLSAGLRRHVPDRARSYVVERRSLGRSRTVRGWGFALEARPWENRQGGFYRHRGVIVTDDGRAFVVETESPSREWTPGDHTHGPPPGATSALSDADTQAIVAQVLAWTGRQSKGPGTTPGRTTRLEQLVADGRITREEADRLAPDGSVSDAAWAEIRNL